MIDYAKLKATHELIRKYYEEHIGNFCLTTTFYGLDGGALYLISGPSLSMDLSFNSLDDVIIKLYELCNNPPLQEKIIESMTLSQIQEDIKQIKREITCPKHLFARQSKGVVCLHCQQKRDIKNDTYYYGEPVNQNGENQNAKTD